MPGAGSVRTGRHAHADTATAHGRAVAKRHAIPADGHATAGSDGHR
jgi:hypothetical protein